jgi:hypothetical protein
MSPENAKVLIMRYLKGLWDLLKKSFSSDKEKP